jgi:putative copper export protein
MGRGETTLSFPSPVALAIGAFQWVEYLGLLGFIGVVVVRRLAANQPPLHWARLPMQPALAVALVGGAGTVVFGGPGGWARVVRVLAEGVALALCLRGVRLVVVPGLLAAVLLAFAGHATRAQPQLAGIAVDAVHVLSAGMWAGGIVAMATVKPPGGWRESDGRALLERFSRVAPLAFAITALTGVLRATEELSAVSDLWATSYGIVLDLKAVGILVMVILSWLAWRRGLQVARLEAGIAVVVIGATALLAAFPVTPAQA